MMMTYNTFGQNIEEVKTWECVKNRCFRLY